MEVLVTGANGFIGRHLCKFLLENGFRVIGADMKGTENPLASEELKTPLIRTSGKGDATPLIRTSGKGVFCEVDVGNRESVFRVFRENNIERVVHLAGISNIRSGMVEQMLDVNMKGTANVLEACSEYNAGIVFASSSTVYGFGNTIPFSESQNVEPPSMYGITKRAGELLCKSYFLKHSVPGTCLRFFTVYGESGREDMAVRKFTKLISQGRPVNMFGDGSSKRDYIHVSDAVEAVFKSLTLGDGFEIINVGTGESTSLLKLIEMIGKKVGKKAEIVKVENPKDEVPVTQADIKKVGRILGWKPKVGIEKGIQGFVDWYLSNGD